MKMVNRIYEERFQMKEINNFVSTNEKIKKLRYVSLQKFKIVPCLLRALKKPKFNFPISLEKSLSRNIVFHLLKTMSLVICHCRQNEVFH